MVDRVAARTASLNADGHSAKLDRAALDVAIRAQGVAFQEAISVGHSWLFADMPLFVTTTQVAQMQAVIVAVGRVVKLSGWMRDSPLPNPLPLAGEGTIVACPAPKTCLGVFYGYDFHLNAQGAHLIEINTNAGGGFLNALLLDSQRDTGLPGKALAVENPEQSFLDMFRNEWRLERGDASLKTVAILDEQPESQYLYPEFLLAQKLFERADIATLIIDPSALQARQDGLYCNERRVDLIYNRLTDFDLQRHPQIFSAYEKKQVVLTPNPAHYLRYADKRKLAVLTDAQALRAIGASETDISTLQAGVPQTLVVWPEMEATLWAERKQWFFKPAAGYGSKGSYRGANVTRRVFQEILHGDYVAQRMAPPGEWLVSMEETLPIAFKFDVRCYVYDGEVQLIAARLYQGQTTNFRTPGGGFALVRVVG